MTKKQAVKFGAIGITNTAISLSLYLLFVSIGFSEGTSYALSCIFSLTLSYHANKKWTFNSYGGGKAFSLFATIQFFLICFGTIAIEFSHTIYQGHHLSVWLFVVGINSVANFYLCKLAVFRD